MAMTSCPIGCFCGLLLRGGGIQCKQGLRDVVGKVIVIFFGPAHAERLGMPGLSVGSSIMLFCVMFRSLRAVSLSAGNSGFASRWLWSRLLGHSHFLSRPEQVC